MTQYIIKLNTVHTFQNIEGGFQKVKTTLLQLQHNISLKKNNCIIYQITG